MAILSKGQISEHFWWREFAQHARPRLGFTSPAPVPDELRVRVTLLCIDILEPLRRLFAAPITIVSGYRSKEYDQARGYVPKNDSQHWHGNAADIRVKGFDSQTVHRTILRLYNDGKLPLLGGVGVYSSWVHVDIRGDGQHRLRRWKG